jgi:glycosyltransferase involved in cell wall biosynthesis
MNLERTTIVPEAADDRVVPFSVYLLDLWSFIPYYMAHLTKALRNESVKVTLGSTKYHLDRNYFRSKGIEVDSLLLDFGGTLKSGPFRRMVKTFEYLVNLAVLGIRLPVSGLGVLHVQFLPFLDRGYRLEIWFLKWIRSRQIKIVCTVHNLADRDSRKGSKPLFKALYELSDAIICHGPEAREQLIGDFGIMPERVWVIPHGPLFAEKPTESQMASRVKLGLPLDETIVLCAGVISEYKGIPFLLDAWKRHLTPGSKSRLLIAGTGDASLLDQIREKVRAEGLADSVGLWLRFIGVDELPLLHQSADILVYPYKACTTSGALLTGLNYEKAIIATRLPFFQGQLKEDVEALMVDFGDTNALAQKLRELSDSPEKRQRLALAVANRPRVDDAWKKIALATIECYSRLFSRGDLRQS